MKNPMTCEEARTFFRDDEEGRLESTHAMYTHLETCAECRRARDEQRAITSLLRERLPRHSASASLKEQIAASLAAAKRQDAMPSIAKARDTNLREASPESKRHAQRVGAAALVVCAIAAAVVLGIGVRRSATEASSPLAIEAVSDHLRVLYAERPIEIASGGIHQVKPWFTGRLDFAPIVAFAGDDAFPLEGGSVAYFVDRKAAAFLFKRRLHAISLFVFRADGLAFPSGEGIPAGTARVHASTSRGFHVLLWQSGDLGYALVSDVDQADLLELAAKVNPP